ncbi:MAG: hypothetical protein JJU33_01515 [Phycisphaerales bacterium]|nr:hypothetical protein [Phycisphaerales bacterium]
MNLSQFFDHWNIAENPFRGEEARHDEVFARLSSPAADESDRPATVHSDFEKILGQLSRPSSSIVFGEKGSGKTAIKIQIDAAVNTHNRERPHEKIYLVHYDDLNSKLDHFHERAGADDPSESFRSIRLVDHIDAILSVGVTRLVDMLVGEPDTPGAESSATDTGPGSEAARAARRMDPGLKKDLVLLQAVYDAHERAHDRTARLRKIVHPPISRSRLAWNLAAVGGWLLPALVLAGFWTVGGGQGGTAWTVAFVAALAFWAIVLLKRLWWDKLGVRRQARRIARQLRMLDRSDMSIARSLEHIEPMDRQPGVLPVSNSDEPRYHMLSRLRRVLGQLGYSGVLVIIDRIDEPTLISGDAERMRAVVWPMFNNKFLQQERIGVKMLLPIELRHALFKESSAFFQEARLDKQSLIERLSWTGPMLYDLCTARLHACLRSGAEPFSLLDLFAEDVTRQDLVDALDQMHQPRDAFKFLYRCLTEHCSNVTADQKEWRIPRLVLDQVRRQEAERLQALYRGIRPA